MNFFSLLRVETERLFRSRFTWLALLVTILSPLAGYRFYRPLLSTSQTGYTTTKLGAYLANPALAGAIGGAAAFALLTIAELNRIHKYHTEVITDTIVSPLTSGLARVMALIIAASAGQVMTILIYLPYTLFKTGSVFDGGLYAAVYLVFMLPAIFFAILFSAATYQITRRAELSLGIFTVFSTLSLTVWKENYLLCWLNPAVWVLSDDFGNSRLIHSVLYNRFFWLLILGGLFLISFLCIRRYGKGILGSFLQNAKKVYPPLAALILLVFGVYTYSAQPFLDHSLAEIDYDSYYNFEFNEALACKAIHVNCVPDVKLGLNNGKAIYSLSNLSGKSQKAVFWINPGYHVTTVTANGRSVPFKDLNKDNMNTKEIAVTLPSDQDIKLAIKYGGLPQEWNILESMQGGLEIGKHYVYLTNQDFSPTLKNIPYEGDEEPPFTGNVILPGNMTPVVFGTGTTELIKENPDGTKKWKLKHKGDCIILYAGDYISQHIKANSLNIEFLYSAKHQKIMQKAHAAETLKQVFEYCTSHYGPLRFSRSETMKIIQTNAYQGGGYAANGASIMDENCFNEDSLKDSLKGAGGSEVMAHEIIHQWWGLGNMFWSEDASSAWSSEGLTVYTTYRLMKELYGEEYAKANYIDVWQKEVDQYFQNFYIRNPKYLNLLPEQYQADIANDLSRVRQYCLAPLQILKAEKRVGGEEKMDEILFSLFNRELNPENPYLTYEDFLTACGLSKEDLNLD